MWRIFGRILLELAARRAGRALREKIAAKLAGGKTPAKRPAPRAAAVSDEQRQTAASNPPTLKAAAPILEQTAADAARPASPGIHTAFAQMGGATTAGLRDAFVEAAQRGTVPKPEAGSRFGKFVQQVVDRGYRSEEHIGRAFDLSKQISGAKSPDDLNALINQHFAIGGAASAAGGQAAAPIGARPADSASGRAKNASARANSAAGSLRRGAGSVIGAIRDQARVMARPSVIWTSPFAAAKPAAAEDQSREPRSGGASPAGAPRKSVWQSIRPIAHSLLSRGRDVRAPANPASPAKPGLWSRIHDAAQASADQTRSDRARTEPGKAALEKAVLPAAGAAAAAVSPAAAIGGRGVTSGLLRPLLASRGGEHAAAPSLMTRVQPVIQTAVQAAAARKDLALSGPPAHAAAASPGGGAQAPASPPPLPPRGAMPYYAQQPGGLTNHLPIGQQVNPAADQAQADSGRKEAIDELKKQTEAIANSTNKLTAFVAAVIALPPATAKFAETLVDGNAALKRYNGQIGYAYAGLEQQRIRRSMQSGQATADSSKDLVGAVSQMEQEIRPLKDILSNTLNRIGVWGARFAGAAAIMVRHLPIISGYAEEIEKTLKENKTSSGVWKDFVGDVAANARKRRSPPLGG